MIIEPSLDNWWIDSTATPHIARSKELFVELKEKKIGENKVYMGNNTYSDVLGDGKCKLSFNGIVLILSDVCRNLIYVSTYSDVLGEGKCKLLFYVPDVHRNLIYVSTR